ncbi:hypothetical protein KPSA1_07603 [Pseudomonas syringae pv. actinidiae]|uniref:Uncharacterized protein n=1 Tax=Pseudomonas syringae pv. actinidiae TaxID=103796 RepID=A0A2V0QMJ3_PSESF|nr:hypothetical protein KPSA1_07603 [Pseudomonas syringae pv. actinidiae]
MPGKGGVRPELCIFILSQRIKYFHHARYVVIWAGSVPPKQVP